MTDMYTVVYGRIRVYGAVRRTCAYIALERQLPADAIQGQ